MSEVWDLFSNINMSMTVFLMIFSLGIALFHTIILNSLFNLKFRGWLFFVLDPALIGIAYLISSPLAGIVFVFLFISVFLLAFIGMLYSGVSGYIEEKRRANWYNKKKTPWWKIILGLLGGGLFFAAFIFLGPYMFIFIIAFIVLSKILPNPTNRFLQLQSILPTSNIRSMAMGLIEVEGKVQRIDYLLAPINSKQCIGYRYTIEDIDKDSDGRTSYSIVKDITVCNDFHMVDDTGQVIVKGGDLEFLWVDMEDRYSSGGKRYTQYLLQDGDEMLLVGKASKEDQETIIEKEEIKKIFMIAPVSSVDKWNKYKPLLKFLIITTIIIAIVAMMILLANITVDGNTVHFRLNDIRFDWNELFDNYF